MSTKPFTTTAKVAGLLGGAAAITLLAWFAIAQDNFSFAKGVVVGGGLTLIAFVVLWSRAARGTTAARMATGQADERERRILREAAADAGAAMFAAGVACAIWALFEPPAIAIAGTVLWTGLLAWGASVIVRSRRG